MAETATQPDTTPEPTPASGAAAIIEKLNSIDERITAGETKSAEDIAELKKSIDEAKKPQRLHDFNIRKGEDPMSSRPYMLTHVLKRQAMQQGWLDGDYRNVAKQEYELAQDLRKYYCGDKIGGTNLAFPVPLGADFLPHEDVTTEEGKTVPAVPAELRKRCRDMMQLDGGVDEGEIVALAKMHGLPLNRTLRKDLSAETATSGGTLVAAMAQGELINVLRATEVFTQIGASEMDLPPQGSIRFPRVTSSVTFVATTEGATISENTPTTGGVLLTAKPYTSLTDIPEELFRFASVNVEAWLRGEFTREAALKIDRDRINGAGGTAVQGVINYSGVQTRTAGTIGANGDTLDIPDPTLLHGDLSDNNAPVDDGSFVYLLTGTLWSGLMTRQATTNEFISQVQAMALGGGRMQKVIHGHKAICTTQVPTDRTKGSGTTLTILLAGVGSEYMIGRAGVLDVQLTNSDASKFQQRISTMRATEYTDGAPKHEESWGFIDDLLNA